LKALAAASGQSEDEGQREEGVRRRFVGGSERRWVDLAWELRIGATVFGMG
jgi:hypothetical protein